MTKKLSEQIHQYFDLMEQIRSQLFRVVDISERYYCITSFSTSLQAMQCALVSKASLMEVKLIEGLTGKELMAFGAIHDALEQWSASGMAGDFPISQDQNVFAAYKSLTREEEVQDDRDLTLGENLLRRSLDDALIEIESMSMTIMLELAGEWCIDTDRSEDALRMMLKRHVRRNHT